MLGEGGQGNHEGFPGLCCGRRLVVCRLPGFLREHDGETDAPGQFEIKLRKRLLKVREIPMAGHLKATFAIEIKHEPHPRENSRTGGIP